MPRTHALLLPSLLAAWLAAPAVAQGPAAGLTALHRVAIEVVVSPDHPDARAETLARRLEAAVHAGRPAPRVDAESPDVLRLTASVHRVSATELRGYYLPFSGTYGIGSVRLAVDRPVTVPGVPGPVRAIVWQAERSVRAPGHRSGAEIAALVDALVAGFLEDYRRAVGP